MYIDLFVSVSTLILSDTILKNEDMNCVNSWSLRLKYNIKWRIIDVISKKTHYGLTFFFAGQGGLKI